MAINLEFDNVTETKGKYTAYIRVVNETGKLLGTVSTEFTDKDDLKNKIREKIQKFQQSDDDLKAKETVITTALTELKAEITK